MDPSSLFQKIGFSEKDNAEGSFIIDNCPVLSRLHIDRGSFPTYKSCVIQSTIQFAFSN